MQPWFEVSSQLMIFSPTYALQWINHILHTKVHKSLAIPSYIKILMGLFMYICKIGVIIRIQESLGGRRLKGKEKEIRARDHPNSPFPF